MTHPSEIGADAILQAIGRKSASATGDGFPAKIFRKVEKPADVVFPAGIDGWLRAKWLRQGDFESGTGRATGVVHGKWNSKKSRVDGEASEAGDGRGEVATVPHRLGDAEAEEMKAFRIKSVDRLVERVGGRR